MKILNNIFQFKYFSYFLNIVFITIILLFLLSELIWQPKDINKFIHADKPVKNEFISSKKNTTIKMQNVLFRFSEEVFLHILKLSGTMYPLQRLKYIDFDNIDAFKIDIATADILITAPVLEVIFNKLFTFKGSKLKNLKIRFFKEESTGKHKLGLDGEMKFGFWLKFKMIASIVLDDANQLLVIKAEKVHALSNPRAKGLLKFLGLNLEKLVAVPPGNILEVKGFEMFIKPLKLFPRPQLSAVVSGVEITKNNQLSLKMNNGKRIKFKKTPNYVKNYLAVQKGMVKFGKLFMRNADLLMIDKDSKDMFDFYLEKYFASLVKGHSKIKLNKSVVAYFPDYK